MLSFFVIFKQRTIVDREKCIKSLIFYFASRDRLLAIAHLIWENTNNADSDS